MSKKIALSMLLTLVIIYFVPLLAYGTLSATMDLKPPEGVSPAIFMISVLVSKVGHALAFVLLFYLARESLAGRWLLYAFVWWLMFVLGEVGQAIGPGYSWLEAVAGIISETIYFPLAAYVTNRMIKVA